jgi:5-methylthioadenosine/S-adenosylhomocysteine deaminase
MSHVLETRSEMQFNIKRYGVTAMERLARTGVLGPDMSLSHFVWATDRDLEILADTGAVASCNPGSNLRLSTGICRVRDIIDAGGRVAFGTDGISFSERDDMFQEIRLAAYLQRLPKGPEPEHGRMDSETLLRSAAANGARAARADDRIGAVAPGKDADLLILRRDRVFWPPTRYRYTPVLDVIMDRTDATDIESVMVAGRMVIDARTITGVNEQRIKDAFAESFDRLFEVRPEFQRLAELPVEVEPYLFAFYRPWAEEAVVPGYEYNTKTGPVGFTGGARRSEVVTHARCV